MDQSCLQWHLCKGGSIPLSAFSVFPCASNQWQTLHATRVVPVRYCVQKMDRCPSRLSVPASCDFVITCVMLQRLMCNVPFIRAVGVKIVRPGNKCKWLEILSDAGFSCHFCWLTSWSILLDRWLFNKMLGPSLCMEWSIACISIDSDISDNLNTWELRCSGLLLRDDVSGQIVGSCLKGVDGGWIRHDPTTLPAEKRRFSYCTVTGRVPGSVCTVAENLGPTGISSRTVQGVASLYTDWAIPAHQDRLSSDINIQHAVAWTI